MLYPVELTAHVEDGGWYRTPALTSKARTRTGASVCAFTITDKHSMPICDGPIARAICTRTWLSIPIWACVRPTYPDCSVSELLCCTHPPERMAAELGSVSSLGRSYLNTDHARCVRLLSAFENRKGQIFKGLDGGRDDALSPGQE